jgi:hypothetical protein
VLCFAGWKLGEALSKRDQERLTKRSQELLDKETPQNEVWTAPDTKAQVQLSVGEAQEQPQTVPFEIDEGIEAPGENVRIEARTYSAGQRLEFRNRPSPTGSEVRGFFERGDNVEVLGRTADDRWLLVGDEGVLVGYAVASDIVAPRPKVAKRVAQPPRAKPKVVQRTARSGAQAQVVTRNPQLAQTRTVSVRANTQCKAVVAQTGSKSDSRRGCALPNGQWAIA